MSKRAVRKKVTGLLTRPAMARRVDLSATSFSLEGREGSRTAGQDGQNGRDGTAGLLSCPSYPSCPKEAARTLQDGFSALGSNGTKPSSNWA